VTYEETPTASDFLNALRYPESPDWKCHEPKFLTSVAEAKARAVALNDESEAFQIWCAQTIASIQLGFISAFRNLKAGKFYDAWCQLERCEVDILSLNRHYPPTNEDIHRIGYIEKMIGRWQSLYPYKVFFSPELLKKRVECSICSARVTPRSHCGHEKGGIYRGELCHHRVTEVKILGISIVENPVQRYSVAFLSADDSGKPIDHYNYGNVNFVVQRVASPFHGWASHLTTRKIAASDVAHLDGSAPCPCLSGKQFADCCAGKTELTVPHLQIQLYVQPAENLPENELLLGDANFK
jgi:hypothetical protein